MLKQLERRQQQHVAASTNHILHAPHIPCRILLKVNLEFIVTDGEIIAAVSLEL